jgi:phage terminase large subunit
VVRAEVYTAKSHSYLCLTFGGSNSALSSNRTNLHPSNSMAEATWQDTLRLRLVERNNRESAFAPIIEQCTFLGDPGWI